MMPRAAYVHVPFCRRRCGYCNFTVAAGREDLVPDYLRAVELELRQLQTPREVDTLFFGGGTPTQLSPASLNRLCRLSREWFPFAEGYEFSVEANPADLDEARLAVLQGAGVNRLSLGGQSFDDRKLEVLQRDHNRSQLQRAISRCRPRFASLALDLIFAVPGETLKAWTADLRAAIAAGVDHVSTYGLTYEKGSAFWGRRRRGLLRPVDEELERAMYETAIDALKAAGWEHYEVSNFARPGHRCRHNEVYWRGESYFAVGPGAARYVDGWRETNHRSTTTYLKRVLAGQSPVAERERLPPADAARERLVFGLRMLEGLDRSEFAAATGFEFDDLVGPALRRFVGQGLLEDTGGRIRLTRAGLLVSDALWPEFLS
ncbi:MAG TPA: radical SAM family heme chaperone HemW [Candidatus Anammoximicrobium sp.]|nr:radical SAM family heme chaperone HemW [Candidatus Anammoximicrobium sp.]